MYELKVKNSVFTIPKENLKLLAMSKAIDLGRFNEKLNTNEDAIKFFESLGMQVNECEVNNG